MKFDIGTGAAAFLAFVVVAAAGCSTTDRVLFVTTTSIGMNLDTKPETASIGYHRIEGYVGPRYQNGAVPPVVASVATGGNVLDPTIRQVYATGSAATQAVGKSRAEIAREKLRGDPTKKRLVFFGTTTNLGFSVGFSGGGIPDSALLGYRRKEFSLIPLATKTEQHGVDHDIYPSVLASINTTASAPSLQGTGLSSIQFFATGSAADSLAENPNIRSMFQQISRDAISASLTAEQRKKAEALASQSLNQQSVRLDVILSCVAPNGTVNPKTLGDLVDSANANAAPNTPISIALKRKQTPKQIAQFLGDKQAAVLDLYNALPDVQGCGVKK